MKRRKHQQSTNKGWGLATSMGYWLIPRVEVYVFCGNAMLVHCVAPKVGAQRFGLIQSGAQKGWVLLCLDFYMEMKGKDRLLCLARILIVYLCPYS
ncbi:hypothetical protein [Microbulbifer thermotolerans]|uniref:hypothetical protein n=1 Tax=Microbulbifer thermotolerans TaxID=252514 RepID=UPI00224AA90B|nr:hypothetical protein [Microbulbifer thermotolerans]MCX2833834.1 hypothetical protein [Microbulbifer thermotolerans]